MLFIVQTVLSYILTCYYVVCVCRWRTAFFVVACPAIVLAHVSAFVLPDASEHEPPPFVPYDHLRIRYGCF